VIDKLKPCPFCRSIKLDPEWEHNGMSASFDGVWCNECGAKGPQYECKMPAELWNHRPREDAMMRVVDAVYRYCEIMEGDNEGPINFKPYRDLRDALYSYEGAFITAVDAAGEGE